MLFKDVRIIGDQDVRRFQNTSGRAVVLLKLNHLQRRKILAQQHQVLRTCAAPGVDRLVIVTHHGKARAAAHQQFHQFILAGVGVLIFVHQQVANFVLPALADFFIALQK